jgi:isoleucyl-tRNA synthetase
MRKEAGFDVTDKISVCVRAGDKLTAVLRGASQGIADDVMAHTFTLGDPDETGYAKDWDINGESARISVKR